MKAFLTFLLFWLKTVGYAIAILVIAGTAVVLGAAISAWAIHWTTLHFPWLMP